MPYRDDVEALQHRCKALEGESAALGGELADARRLLDEALARRRLPIVDDLRVAAPCSADWAKMVGDERVRFCAGCEKSVYNLSEMTRAEAQSLLVAKEGKLCVRYYQRTDGTILTTDCPVGVRRRRRRRRVAAVAFGAMSALAAAGAVVSSRSPTKLPMPVSCSLGEGHLEQVIPYVPPPAPPPPSPPVEGMRGPVMGVAVLRHDPPPKRTAPGNRPTAAGKRRPAR